MARKKEAARNHAAKRTSEESLDELTQRWLREKALAEAQDAIEVLQPAHNADQIRTLEKRVFDLKQAPRAKVEVLPPVKRNTLLTAEEIEAAKPNPRSKQYLLQAMAERGLKLRHIEDAATAYDNGEHIEPFTRLSSAVIDYLEAAGQTQERIAWCAFPYYVWDARTAAGRELVENGWAGSTYVVSRETRRMAEEAGEEKQAEAQSRLLAALCCGWTNDEFLE